MTTLENGQKAPNFSMPANGGELVTLADYSGKWLVLYFYPKDDTPGCTTEAKTFTELKDKFTALNADIVGVSRDTVAKHEKFVAKHDLAVALGSDEDGKVTEDYGVWVEKKMYGKTYMGIERATYLINPDGAIEQIWRKVRVKGHVEAVLEALESAHG